MRTGGRALCFEVCPTRTFGARRIRNRLPGMSWSLWDDEMVTSTADLGPPRNLLVNSLTNRHPRGVHLARLADHGSIDILEPMANTRPPCRFCSVSACPATSASLEASHRADFRRSGRGRQTWLLSIGRPARCRPSEPSRRIAMRRGGAIARRAAFTSAPRTLGRWRAWSGRRAASLARKGRRPRLTLPHLYRPARAAPARQLALTCAFDCRLITASWAPRDPPPCRGSRRITGPMTGLT